MKTQLPPRGIEALATAGFAAKGVVYLAVGIFSAIAASKGNTAPGKKGALGKLNESVGGGIFLALMGVGLICYGIYRLFCATLDIEEVGTDKKGIVKRIGFTWSGLSYLVLGTAALVGLGQSSGKQSLVTSIMQNTFGRVVIFIIGLAVIGAGIMQFVKVYKKSYEDDFDMKNYSAKKRHIVERIAQFGICARGVVFPIMGYYLCDAAVNNDASQMKGLGGAIQKTASTPAGPWLLVIVAIGLMCYGLYCWVVAAFNKWHTKAASSPTAANSVV